MEAIPNKWIEKERKSKEKPVIDTPAKDIEVSTAPYIHLARAIRMRTLRGLRK